MNHGIYRLVFNSERNSWIAVAENVRGRGKKSNRRHLAAVVLGLAAVGAGGDMALAAPPAATALPVPSTAKPFVFAGAVTGGQPTTVGNTMTINTASRTLGLNWQSFNIGSSAKVEFVQPDAASRVLNRIWDNNPTQIMGQLKANGQVYLVNQNGILFGAGAQVNVGGLVASSLNLSDAMASKLLNYGLPTARGDSLEFAWDGDLAGFNAGSVIVEAGAEIRSRFGGRVVLIAPKTVENRGLIARSDEDGTAFEAILAAGGKVILTAPDDPSLRGLLVETQAVSAKDALGNNVALDGSVTNSGQVNAGTGGVVSLAALAVNQKGLVNATKAVNINGTTMLVSGTTETDLLTVNQRGDVAEIDWANGFNVGFGKTVEFVQASAGAVAYNYVYDPDRTAADGSILNTAGRSSIDGILKASGQFVLINEKGIDFGATAKVSASNFVASALGINPAIISSGLLGQTSVKTRAFYLNKTPVSYSEGDPDRQQVFDQALEVARQATINVKNGAEIKSGKSGYVILAGMKIDQAGSVSSDSGQVLLAAGADLYLKPGYASAMRGFTAEVNPLYVVRAKKFDEQGSLVEDASANRAWLALSRGADANSVINTGVISASYGDISLVGHEITQAGMLLASTSATANGSIHLVARDQLNIQGDGEPAVGSTFWRQYGDQGILASTGTSIVSTADSVSEFVSGKFGGKLTFAAGSKTVVEIDGSNGKTLTEDQAFVKSSIDAVAKKIVVADADIEAKGGNIRMRASDQFGEFQAFAIDTAVVDTPTSRPTDSVGIFIGDGARIDASGTNASKSVADLFIEVELRGDEFADNPVQRDGMLRGEKAWVDIRDKVSIANLDGWVKKVGQSVFEKASGGGEISLGSTGSVIVKSGGVLDVSGGKVDYAGSTVKESVAITQGGKRYRLNDAPASAAYAALVTTQRTESAYVEGKSAGTVELTGHSLAVDGNLVAKTTVGTRQRELGNPTSNRYAIPYGGRLIIKDAGQHYVVANPDTASEAEKIAAYTQAQIKFVSGAAGAAADLTENSIAGQQLELSTSLVDAGFSRFDISSEGRIDIPADVSLNLPAGGSFAASARQIYVAGDIVAPSGSISLTTNDMSATTAPGAKKTTTMALGDAEFSTLTLDSDASLSTAGLWVNDYLDGRLSKMAKAINGGSITLTSAYDLDLRAGSSVDVSGGGWVNYKGSLSAGNAGSITLVTGGAESAGYDFAAGADRRDASLFLDGTLSGYALGKGGTLTIKTSAISFGETFVKDSRNWNREKRLAEDQVGAAFDPDFVDRGGFFSFNFVGRDGLTVADDVRLMPDPVSWSLVGVSNYRYRPTDSNLADFVQSLVLHPELRGAPTNLSLATRSLNFGNLLIGEDAYVGVSSQGSISLESWRQLTVLGTLEAPAGKLSLSLKRPANTSEQPYANEKLAYTEKKQSESIYLGPNSSLLAGGATVLTAATRLALDSGASASYLLGQSRYKGSVLDGGTVSLDAGLGYVITRSGSLIDVSGTTDTLNMATSTGSGTAYPSLTVGSAGGTVNIAARDGMFLDGGFEASGDKGALGGSFNLSFTGLKNDSNPWGIVIPLGIDKKPDISLLPSGERAVVSDRQLTLYQSSDEHAETWPDGVDGEKYLAGKSVIDAAKYNGKASFDLASLVQGGFGSWLLSSQNEIRFSGAITATVSNQLSLNAPKFSAVNDATQLVLTAAAVQLGNNKVGATASPASLGGASATINALDIGLVGTFGWNGFGSSTFVSQGEIHFDSVGATGSDYKGQMSASGNLILSAARLSPATYSNFRVDLLADPNGSIAITRPDNAVADVSLSAGGRLEFAAKTITHDGTISAPLGEIVFNAPGGEVTLGSGSITSVAADRKLLLGYTTESGTSWQYLGSEIGALPSKSIRIDAADTKVTDGAKFDLSGGGDAVAWEFTEGPGGKKDILSASTATFAIIPGWNGFTATDGELQQGYLNSTAELAASLKAGDRISLASNPAGLSGSYVLLPARYAVLPGAYLVTVKSGKESVLSGAQTQADGSWLVSGARLAMNADGTTTSYSSAALTLELASNSVTAKRAAYTTTTANQFFFDDAGAKLSGDAGRLTAIGRKSLVFDPTIIAMRTAEISAADGRKRAGSGLELDLAAPKLLVSDSAGATEAGWSRLNQDKLNALSASSLLLGGARTVSGATTSIESIATDVKVSNSKSALSAAELLLTATENLTVTGDSGGRIASRIESKGSAEVRDIVLSGDGAFLRVAEGAQASLARAESSVSRTQGDLNIEAGASIAGQSLIFDATRDNTLDGNVVLGTRQSDGSRTADGAIAIGAGRLNVVADGSTPDDGLTLDNAYLARFATADQLRLASYSTLDLYGNAILGAASLKDLVIAAGGIAGHGDADSAATIEAQRVSFINPKSGAVFATKDALGYGGLSVQATTIEFGDNATVTRREAETAGFAMRGFGNVDLVASGDVRFSGTGVTTIDNVGGSGNAANLSIDAGRVVTVDTADHLLLASGATKITRNADASAVETATGLGGSLELRGKSIDVSGEIDVAAGNVTLSGTDYLTILKNAFVGAEGRKVAFDDTYAYASGGRVTLKSDEGKVTVQSGAVVSVSADAGGGDAGSLSLLAPKGEVSAAAGTLRGSAASDAGQGAMKVDAKSVSLDDLADAVVDGDGQRHFTGSWDVRRRSGDLSLNKEIKAQAVKLAADAGSIDVSGSIDASGSKGGKIELYANRANGIGGWVNLLAGSKLKAYAEDSVGTGQGTKGKGGTVIVGVSATAAADELATGINFEAAIPEKTGVAAKLAAEIDVSTADGSAAEAGKVIFRAPRQDTVEALKTLQGGALNWSSALIAPDATGSATAFNLTPTSPMPEYQLGMVAAFKAPLASTGPLTLNVSGKGAKAVLRADGSPLQASDITKDGIVVAVYDGVAFRLQTAWVADTGSANTYKVAPAVRAQTVADLKTAGYSVTFRAKTANTAKSTVEIATADGNKTSVDLKREDGGVLQRNDIASNQLVTAVYVITDAEKGTGEFRIVNNTELATGPVTKTSMASVKLAGDVNGAATVALESVRTSSRVGDVVLGATQQAVLLAGAAAANGSALLSAADSTGHLGLVYRMGEEIRASGNITVYNDWSFSKARYANQPGTLTLRAEGDLNINGTLSDGFVRGGSTTTPIYDVSRDATLMSNGDSWSFQLVAGADTKQASPLATNVSANVGNITLAENKLVRTGTGSIDLAAAKDIKLKERSAVYTAGVSDARQIEGFRTFDIGGSTTKKIASVFPVGGGDITLTSGGRIVMDKNPTAIYQGHVNEWLLRTAATNTRSTQWFSRIGSFQQGVAAFGGGDIAMTAGGEIRDAIVAIPTSGRIPQSNGVNQPDDVVITGGGDLKVRAAGAIVGGMFYAETGRLSLDAAEIKPSEIVVNKNNVETLYTYQTSIAMGNAEVSVVSRGDTQLGNVFNPLWTSTEYLYNNATTGAATKDLNTSKEFEQIRIGTYGANSSVAVVSLAGNVSLTPEDTSYGITDGEAHRLMPSQVSVVALNGDIKGSLAQAPGENSQLDFLARDSIRLSGVITQLDVPLDALPSIRNPILEGGKRGGDFKLLGLLKEGSNLEKHSASGWHTNDSKPSRLIALNGDITGLEKSDTSSDFNEAVRIKAGGDIVDLNLSIQHNHLSDVSSIVAGGNIKYTTTNSSKALNGANIIFAPLGIDVSGPGSVEVIAGKSIDLADTWGIVTSGNLNNPYLPETGAGIMVSAGATPDYESLRVFLKVGKEVSDADLRQRFFTLLRDYGKEAQATGDDSSYEKGRLLAKALYPTESISNGDIKLSVSQIKTEQGGGVNLFAPGGSIQVGVADPTLDKKASEQGIFTIRDGEIFAYVANNFLVNQSRVFTLDGGDIMIWADQGNIDAGSGSKTLISTPPPVPVVRNGHIELDTSNSISGSGIGVLASRDDTPASDMSLFAPEGAIDAGDAGLRSTGSITLGARVILNANNIQAAGSVSGAPAPVAAAAPVAMSTTPSNSENKALEDAAPAAGKRDSAGGMLTVEVLDSEPVADPATIEDEERKRKARARAAG